MALKSGSSYSGSCVVEKKSPPCPHRLGQPQSHLQLPGGGGGLREVGSWRGDPPWVPHLRRKTAQHWDQEPAPGRDTTSGTPFSLRPLNRVCSWQKMPSRPGSAHLLEENNLHAAKPTPEGATGEPWGVRWEDVLWSLSCDRISHGLLSPVWSVGFLLHVTMEVYSSGSLASVAAA